MPIYKVKIAFRDTLLLGDEDYSFNTWVTAASTSVAWSHAENLASALLSEAMPTTVVCTLIGVSQPDVVNGSLNIAQNSPGFREPTGDPLPGWNVVRMQFAGAVGERLHTFYLRMGLTEGDVTGQSLASATNTAVANTITGLLVPGVMCDKDGQVFAFGDHSSLVQMRQMGWRRRHKPGFKRGWVPV